MELLKYEIDQGFLPERTLGVIVLQTDETIENEFRQIFSASPSYALYHSRIANATEINELSLQKMADEMPKSAKLFPNKEFKTIAYACTSGATVIGSNKIEQLIQSVIPNASVTDPIRATLRALKALNIKKLGFITPYIAEVSEKMREKIVADSFEIAHFASFNQSNDEIVARISSNSILQAIESVSEQSDCDAIFVSCTSLRVLPIIALAEEKIKKPVLSSNLVLAWDMLRLTDQNFEKAPFKRFGQLFSV